MIETKIRIPIEADEQTVWENIRDFGNIYFWNPSVNHSHLLSESDTGVGCERQCNMAMGSHIRERVTEWREGQGYTLEIYEAKRMPLKKAVAALEVVEEDGVVYGCAELRAELKGGRLTEVLMGPMMRKMFHDMVKGLKAKSEEQLQRGHAA